MLDCISETLFDTNTDHLEGSAAIHARATWESDHARIESILLFILEITFSISLFRSTAAHSSRRGIVMVRTGATRVFAVKIRGSPLPSACEALAYTTAAYACLLASANPWICIWVSMVVPSHLGIFMRPTPLRI